MSFARVFNGLGEFGRFLDGCVARAALAQEAAVALSADVVEKRVKSIYGDESKLAPISQDSTAQLRSDGGAGGPLYIDGELLKGSVEKEVAGDWAGVGSPEIIHKYHELGYTTAPTSMIPNKIVPPRPVFKIALDESQADLVAISEDLVAVTLGEPSRLALPILESE